MAKDHYVFIGSHKAIAVEMTDKAVVPQGDEHIEPIRGSKYTLAVFSLGEWKAFRERLLTRTPRAMGYCTAHALGYTDAKEWMAATNYKPFDKEDK